MAFLDDEARRAAVRDALGRAGGSESSAVSDEARPPSATRRALTEALLDGALGDGDAAGGVRAPATALGAAWHQAGGSPADLTREAARVVRALDETLEERGGSVEARNRLRAAGVEAVAWAVEAHAAGRRRRRDGWLSFYAHELRNPLNTLVNALWILRNSEDPVQTRRLCDMADRAVRRMEALIDDVRRMEAKGDEPSPRETGRP